MTGNKSRCLNSISQVLLTLLILHCLQCHSRPHSYDSKPLLEISKEIFKYSDIAQRIINLAVYGKAEVMVVESFEELKKRASEAKGKIVVYNQPFVSYGETVAYRASGASEAAKVGAVASLIRSVTPFSINSPHTGWQWYQPGVPQIPTACITVEDAQMMARMARRGQRIVLRLTMGAQTLPDVDSYNTVAEITGSKHPEQVGEFK
uniref:Carboxypeptidase Q n=1 Tax=Cyprinus carpio TaxID=7962 RepID=A0A8C1P9N2_CYPCA